MNDFLGVTNPVIENQIMPTEPAVNPNARKKINSNKSRGREFTIRLI